MIRLFTGTPSSGKSFNAVRTILMHLRFKKPVIANFALKFTEKEIKRGYDKNFYYVPSNQFTIEMLILFALSHNFIEKRKESQCLVVFDEAGGRWNPKSEKKEIVEWIDFFSQHAKIGFDCILIAQSRAMMDRQVQKFIEYDVIHRKANRFGAFSLLPFPVFVAVERWMQVDEKIGSEFFLYSKKVSAHYDRYKMFDGFKLSPSLMVKIRERQTEFGDVSDLDSEEGALIKALRSDCINNNKLPIDDIEDLKDLDQPLGEVFVKGK